MKHYIILLITIISIGHSKDKEIHFMDYLKQNHAVKYNFTHTIKKTAHREGHIDKGIVTNTYTIKDNEVIESIVDPRGTKMTWVYEYDEKSLKLKSLKMINEKDKFQSISKFNPPLLMLSQNMLKKKADTLKLKYTIHSTTIINEEKTVKEEKHSIQMMYEFVHQFKGYKNVLKKQIFYPSINNQQCYSAVPFVPIPVRNAVRISVLYFPRRSSRSSSLLSSVAACGWAFLIRFLLCGYLLYSWALRWGLACSCSPFTWPTSGCIENSIDSNALPVVASWKWSSVVLLMAVCRRGWSLSCMPFVCYSPHWHC